MTTLKKTKATKSATAGEMKETTDHPCIPKMVCQDFSKDFVPAYLSNGLIGIRPGPNPLAQAKTFVSGFVHSWVHQKGIEDLSPAPYPLGADVKVNYGPYSVSLLEHPELLTVQRQTVDMATGELLTEMTFAPDSNSKLELKVLQFASRSVPCLLCQEMSITPSADLSIEVVARIGMEKIPGAVYMHQSRENVDMAIGLCSDLDSKLGVSVIVPTGEAFRRRGEMVANESAFTRSYTLEAKRGNTYSFRTIAAMVSQVYHPHPELQAIRMANWGRMLGFAQLREQNQENWKELWKSRVKVYGDAGAGDAQRALDVAFFYLHSTVHPSSRTGMSPFGLSKHGPYFGHSFWDTETWSFLPVVLASPPAARSLLEYRLRSLENARKMAALYGCRGAQYPWEGAQVDGSDATPTEEDTGWASHHITPDVGLAFWEYQLATDYLSFLQEATWPVLKAIAEWIESRGVYTERGFEIRNVMGPDESVPNINNSSYLNIVSKMVMNAAVKCARKLGLTPHHSWEEIARSIVIPVDETGKIVLPYDNPPEPEDKAYTLGNAGELLFLHEPPLSSDLLESTYKYEEKLRVSRPPLWGGVSDCSQAAMAAFYGEKRKAAELFRNSWEPNWLEPYGITKEGGEDIECICFVTNFGSLLQTVMLGFTGLRICDGDWCKYPATLPEGWTRIVIDRIWVRGVPKRLVAEDGKKARLLD